jgi:hypothetical protein
MDSAMVHAPALRLRDRLSLQVRLWRARRVGLGDRRTAMLVAACDAAQGEWLCSVVEGPASSSGIGVMGSAELHLFDGAVLDLGVCHRPTVAKLRQAMASGPVIVERIADHGHCFGVYVRTTAGSLGLLVPRLLVAPGHGGLRTEGRPLAFA